jgi:hypothetical protein
VRLGVGNVCALRCSMVGGYSSPMRRNEGAGVKWLIWSAGLMAAIACGASTPDTGPADGAASDSGGASGSSGSGGGNSGSSSGGTSSSGGGTSSSSGSTGSSGAGNSSGSSSGSSGSSSSGSSSGGDAGRDSAVGQDASETACGATTCPSGRYCCNAACGLCAPLGVLCIQGCDGGINDASLTGCKAMSSNDAMCPSGGPPHFYTCTLVSPPSNCVILSSFGSGDTACCP